VKSRGSGTVEEVATTGDTLGLAALNSLQERVAKIFPFENIAKRKISFKSV